MSTGTKDPWADYVPPPPPVDRPDQRARKARAAALKVFPHPLFRGAHLLPFACQKNPLGDLVHRLERDESLRGAELRIWRRSFEDVEDIVRGTDRADLQGMPYLFLVTHQSTPWCAFYDERDLQAWFDAYAIRSSDGSRPDAWALPVHESTTVSLPVDWAEARPLIREVGLYAKGDDGMASSLVLSAHCKHNGGNRYRTRLGIGYVPPTELARRTHGGPMVPGPYPYTYPLATVIASARNAVDPVWEARRDNREVDVEMGSLYRIDGQVYELVDDVPLDYPRFKPVAAV